MHSTSNRIVFRWSLRSLSEHRLKDCRERCASRETLAMRPGSTRLKKLKKGRRWRPFSEFGYPYGLASVLLAELVHSTAGVQDLLLAREERMTVRAHLDLQIVAQGRACHEGVPATAGHIRLFIFGVDSVFHSFGHKGPSQKAAQFSGASPGLQDRNKLLRCAPFTLPDSDRGYPQKLWISVWMTGLRKPTEGFNYVTSSSWLFFSQGVFT